MRAFVFAVLCLISTLPSMGQNADDQKPGLPDDPYQLLAAAVPYYDFSSPDLKPWHMKVSYQLYDLKGKPAEIGGRSGSPGLKAATIEALHSRA